MRPLLQPGLRLPDSGLPPLPRIVFGGRHGTDARKIHVAFEPAVQDTSSINEARPLVHLLCKSIEWVQGAPMHYRR